MRLDVIQHCDRNQCWRMVESNEGVSCQTLFMTSHPQPQPSRITTMPPNRASWGLRAVEGASIQLDITQQLPGRLGMAKPNVLLPMVNGCWISLWKWPQSLSAKAQTWPGDVLLFHTKETRNSLETFPSLLPALSLSVLPLSFPTFYSRLFLPLTILTPPTRFKPTTSVILSAGRDDPSVHYTGPSSLHHVEIHLPRKGRRVRNQDHVPRQRTRASLSPAARLSCHRVHPSQHQKSSCLRQPTNHFRQCPLLFGTMESISQRNHFR